MKADGVVRGLSWFALILLCVAVWAAHELGHASSRLDALERQVTQLEQLHREDVEAGPATWGQGSLAGEDAADLVIGPVVGPAAAAPYRPEVRP